MFKKIKIHIYLFLIIFTPIIFLTKTDVSIGGNEAARLASVQSLVEQKTFIIDDSLFIWTVDKVLLDGHYYAGKPPLFTVICAAIYALLRDFMGLSFESNYKSCIYLISLLGTGALTCLLGPFFYKALNDFFCISLCNSFLLTLLLFGGTLIGVYIITINNHTPGAALLFLGFYFFFRGKINTGKFIQKEIFVSSIFMAIAASLEIPAGVIFATLMIFILIKNKEYPELGFFLIPLVFFILINIGINFATSGRIFHPPVYSYGWNYAGSYMETSIHGLSASKNIIPYAFHILLGYRGLFIFSPILILGIVGIWLILKEPKHRLRLPATTVLVGTGLFYIIHIFITGDFGGPAYGYRFWIPLIPMLYLFSGQIFDNGFKTQFKSLIFFVGFFSIALTFLGTLSPWVPVHEGYREEFKINNNILSLSKIVRFSPTAILTARIDKLIPCSAISKKMKKMFIHKNENYANSWLGYYYLVLRKKEKAGRYFYNVLQKDPNNIYAKNYLEGISRGKY